jgi:hypothetical protein
MSEVSKELYPILTDQDSVSVTFRATMTLTMVLWLQIVLSDLIQKYHIMIFLT